MSKHTFQVGERAYYRDTFGVLVQVEITSFTPSAHRMYVKRIATDEKLTFTRRPSATLESGGCYALAGHGYPLISAQKVEEAPVKAPRMRVEVKTGDWSATFFLSDEGWEVGSMPVPPTGGDPEVFRIYSLFVMKVAAALRNLQAPPSDDRRVILESFGIKL
jgi:hypothetical protein